VTTNYWWRILFVISGDDIAGRQILLYDNKVVVNMEIINTVAQSVVYINL
jgi:hypothetical protein